MPPSRELSPLLVGLFGLVGCFVTVLTKPVLIAETAAAVMLFAGGVAYAVQLKGVDCSDEDVLFDVAQRID